MSVENNKAPQMFERDGKTYIGHAIAIRDQGGSEIIILAPTLDEAEVAAHQWGQLEVDRSQIKKAALMGIASFSARKRP